MVEASDLSHPGQTMLGNEANILQRAVQRRRHRRARKPKRRSSRGNERAGEDAEGCKFAVF